MLIKLIKKTYLKEAAVVGATLKLALKIKAGWKNCFKINIVLEQTHTRQAQW